MSILLTIKAIMDSKALSNQKILAIAKLIKEEKESAVSAAEEKAFNDGMEAQENSYEDGRDDGYGIGYDCGYDDAKKDIRDSKRAEIEKKDKDIIEVGLKEQPLILSPYSSDSSD